MGSSITSAYKSVVSTVSKTVSKSSSTNSKSSSSGNKTSGSSKSSSSGNKASGSTSNKTSSSGKKTSATATSKTVSSNASKVSSTSKKSTTTKYVTNAAAIYNASGKKVSAPSSVSTGRPKQSYISQQKTSTAKGKVTAQTKLPVPVAQKAPLVTKTSTSKKDASEASYSNNRPKQSYTHVVAYTPTASREGAGQMFYRNKTEPKGAKAGASFATSCIPYLGDAKDIQEAVTGKDLITGKIGNCETNSKSCL